MTQEPVVKRYKSMYAKVVLDSVTSRGHRLVTVEAKYPRYIHSEALTHRALSRNAASSRAIPFTKMLALSTSDPWVPDVWPAEQKGMQGGEPLSEEMSRLATDKWLDMARYVAKGCEDLAGYGVHKSMCNRPMEWFSYITTVFTATHWQNFFRLRCHKAAEPRFQIMAGLVRAAIMDSVPRRLNDGEWHLPYVDPKVDVPDPQIAYDREQMLVMLSTARCARVSYLNQAGVRSWEDDVRLYNQLLSGAGDEQPHASPFEHPAFAMAEPAWSGNFFGWFQHRKQLLNEVAPELPYEGPVLEVAA